ncbi:hypothetical protein BS78_02G273800 [Paspalum vaginatum]|nr:hypothetical protein BS78_02G273800 [Paspalum vaginatum]
MAAVHGFGRRRQLNNRAPPAPAGGAGRDPDDDGGRLRPRGGNVAWRLRAYAATYMMLGGAFLLRAVAEEAKYLLANADHVAGFLLWIAGVSLLLLSFLDRRFPTVAAAAARLAYAALERVL